MNKVKRNKFISLILLTIIIITAVLLGACMKQKDTRDTIGGTENSTQSMIDTDAATNSSDNQTNDPQDLSNSPDNQTYNPQDLINSPDNQTNNSNKQINPVTPATEQLDKDEEAHQEEPLHLYGYELFDKYNTLWDCFKGFVLSETWIDGKPYYQLLNKEKDIKVLVDDTQSNAVIYHHGKSMEYQMELLISPTTAYAAIDVLDVTLDGEDDLIIRQGYGGTGVWTDFCDVIKLDTMTIYEMDEFIYELSSRVTIEPVEINDNSIIYRITDTEGNEYYGSGFAHSTDMSDYSYVPSTYNSNYHIEIDYDKKLLTVDIGLIVGFQNYLGSLDAYLLFNSDTNRFEVSDAYTLNIENLVEVE